MDPNDPVVVYRTSNPAEAEFLKMALEGEGIKCLVTGETQGGFAGVIPEVTLTVRSSQADRAREIIEAQQSQRSENPE
jgi:hypothetical protein